MYFENFHEDIGTFDESILDNLKQVLFNIDLSNPLLTRPEYCFKDGGKLILPLHFGRVTDEEYFPLVKPLIKLIQSTRHPCLANTMPFRVEISIIEPNKTVKWHMDQHVYHKFSERIHIPVITNSQVEFVSKWFTDDTPYKFTMTPGHMYRYNNRVLHTVKNPANVFRCHIMVDFIHRGVFDYFMSKNIEDLGNNVTVTPADEIYFLVNRNIIGAEPTTYTADDLEELEAVKNYYLLQHAPEKAAELSPEQLLKVKALNKYDY